MESILRATCSLGLIVYSFDREKWPFIDQHGRPGCSVSNKNLLRNLASATEDLLEILESLNSSPHNPMADLPSEFENIAEACATDVEKIRREMGKGIGLARFPFHFGVNITELTTWTSTLQSYNDLLSPQAKSLTRNAGMLRKLQNTQPAVVSAISGMVSNDGIDLKAGIPRHLNTLAKDLLLGGMDFSSPQLYRVLRTLDEIRDEQFPNEHFEFANKVGPMDEDDEEFWFCEEWEVLFEKLDECRQNLGLISLLNHPEDPTPEARDAIIVLQKLTLALRCASQQNVKSSVRAGIKRKAEDKEDELEVRREKPVRSYLPILRAPCKSAPALYRNGVFDGYKHKVIS